MEFQLDPFTRFRPYARNLRVNDHAAERMEASTSRNIKKNASI